MRKETVDIDILVTSRIGDRKIMQAVTIMSRPLSRIRKWNQLSQFQMNIYQNNTYRKGLSWLHFNYEARVQERQQVENQRSYISVFVVYLTIPSSCQKHQPRHYSSIPEKPSNLRREKLHRTNQGSNFLWSSFSNRENLRTSIQFRRERQPKHLKRWFFLKNSPIHFQ